MGLFNILDPVLDFIFSPILKLDPLWGILFISLIVTLIITLIHKYTTDQTLMKNLKKKQKEFNKKIKEARNDPEKAMKIQKEAAATSLEYMKHSFRPMFFTFIPIIIIFGWLSANFAYHPILPQEEFVTEVSFAKDATGEVMLTVPDELTLISDPSQTITDSAVSWKLKGPKGEAMLMYEYNGERYFKRVLITDSVKYVPPLKTRKTFIDYIYTRNDGFLPSGSSIIKISVENRPLKPLPFSIFGWEPGWLGTYILCSIFLSLIVRKILKVH